ncbi:uncharacterized protein LOC144599123 isoform X1 [Rhinoraja longicauda]
MCGPSLTSTAARAALGGGVNTREHSKIKKTSPALIQQWLTSPSSIHRRSLELRYAALRPIIPVPGLPARGLPARPSVKRSSVVSLNLRPLAWEPLPDRSSPVVPAVPAKVALINARSLQNKTFILNDFFITRGLDFLLLTESWLNPGELAPLVELCPDNCNFFTSPRLSGRGGGLATVFKKHFNCRLLNADHFSSFEILMNVQPKLQTVNKSAPTESEATSAVVTQASALMGPTHRFVLVVVFIHINYLTCSSR